LRVWASETGSGSSGVSTRDWVRTHASTSECECARDQHCNCVCQTRTLPRIHPVVRTYARTHPLAGDTALDGSKRERSLHEKWSAAHVAKRESVRSRDFTSSYEHDTTTHSQEVRFTARVCLHGLLVYCSNPRKAKEGACMAPTATPRRWSCCVGSGHAEWPFSTLRHAHRRRYYAC
jgi:hypothetical protein